MSWIYNKLNNRCNNIENDLEKSKSYSHTSLAFSPIEIHRRQISNHDGDIHNYRITHVCSTIKLPLHVVNCMRVQQQKAWPELVRLQFFFLSFLDFRLPLNICSFGSSSLARSANSNLICVPLLCIQSNSCDWLSLSQHRVELCIGIFACQSDIMWVSSTSAGNSIAYASMSVDFGSLWQRTSSCGHSFYKKERQNNLSRGDRRIK